MKDKNNYWVLFYIDSVQKSSETYILQGKFFKNQRCFSNRSDICTRNTIIDFMLSSIRFVGRKFLKTYNLHSVVDFIPFTRPPVVCHSFEAGWAVRLSAAYTSLPPHSAGLPSARVLDTKYFPFCPRVTPSMAPPSSSVSPSFLRSLLWPRRRISFWRRKKRGWKRTVAIVNGVGYGQRKRI